MIQLTHELFTNVFLQVINLEFDNKYEFDSAPKLISYDSFIQMYTGETLWFNITNVTDLQSDSYYLKIMSLNNTWNFTYVLN